MVFCSVGRKGRHRNPVRTRLVMSVEKSLRLKCSLLAASRSIRLARKVLWIHLKLNLCQSERIVVASARPPCAPGRDLSTWLQMLRVCSESGNNFSSADSGIKMRSGRIVNGVMTLSQGASLGRHSSLDWTYQWRWPR